MGFTLNLTDDEIKSAQGFLLPAGVYGATIFDCNLKDSKSGNKMYVVTYRIDEGVAGRGSKQNGYYAIIPDKLWIVCNFLKALGLETPTLENKGTYEFPDPSELIGMQVNIKITQEEYTGLDKQTNQPVKRETNRVSSVTPYNEENITKAGEETSSSSTLNNYL